MNETILNYGALDCPADWRDEGPPPEGVMARGTTAALCQRE